MTNQELEKIYYEAYKPVYWTAMSLLKNESDAEDIVQETFITLIKSYDTIQDKSKVVSWLKKTAANKCLDRIKLTKTVDVEDDFFDNVEDVPENFLPDALLESADTRKVLMDIIEKSLSEDVRRTIILYYYDEMTAKETAICSQYRNSTFTAICQSILFPIKRKCFAKTAPGPAPRGERSAAAACGPGAAVV